MKVKVTKADGSAQIVDNVVRVSFPFRCGQNPRYTAALAELEVVRETNGVRKVLKFSLVTSAEMI